MEYVEHTRKVLYNLVRGFKTRSLKMDFPPSLHILLHMIDFMSYYRFILCIINVLHKLKYRTRYLACKVIFECPPLDCACTKMSKTLQSYKTYSILKHHLFKTCFKPKNTSVVKKYC